MMWTIPNFVKYFQSKLLIKNSILIQFLRKGKKKKKEKEKKEIS